MREGSRVGPTQELAAILQAVSNGDDHCPHLLFLDIQLIHLPNAVVYPLLAALQSATQCPLALGAYYNQVPDHVPAHQRWRNSTLNQQGFRLLLAF